MSYHPLHPIQPARPDARCLEVRGPGVTLARNPWEDIALDDYEAHMALGSVAQLQALNALMREQFAACPPGSVAVFGVAGGNGLEHVDPARAQVVYGVDVNRDYLAQAVARYGQGAWFVPVRADLTDPAAGLPQAGSVLADLLIEYVGVEPFAAAVRRVGAAFVSCVIQVDRSADWVSDSPYLHAFDGLGAVHAAVDESRLVSVLESAGFTCAYRGETPLPNGKKFIRLDFAR